MFSHRLPVVSVLLFVLLITGCSSFLTAVKNDPYVEDSGSRTSGSFLDDQLIETKAMVNINKASEELNDSNISVVSFNGIVLLIGQVSREELRQQAAEAVSMVGGIRRLHNEITVSGTASLVARSNDSWITSKLKSKMLFNGEIESGRIKVVTENGVVYLMGLVSRQEADRAAEVARTTAGVQKVVRIFEYI